MLLNTLQLAVRACETGGDNIRSSEGSSEGGQGTIHQYLFTSSCDKHQATSG